MRTRASLVPGEHLIIGGQLGTVRVGHLRRPVLRLVAIDPVTHHPISADLDEIPPTENFALPLDGGIEGDARPVFLVPHPAWEAEHRREIKAFAEVARRWRAEQRAAGKLASRPHYDFV